MDGAKKKSKLERSQWECKLKLSIQSSSYNWSAYSSAIKIMYMPLLKWFHYISPTWFQLIVLELGNAVSSLLSFSIPSMTHLDKSQYIHLIINLSYSHTIDGYLAVRHVPIKYFYLLLLFFFKFKCCCLILRRSQSPDITAKWIFPSSIKAKFTFVIKAGLRCEAGWTSECAGRGSDIVRGRGILPLKCSVFYAQMKHKCPAAY